MIGETYTVAWSNLYHYSEEVHVQTKSIKKWFASVMTPVINFLNLVEVDPLFLSETGVCTPRKRCKAYVKGKKCILKFNQSSYSFSLTFKCIRCRK